MRVRCTLAALALCVAATVPVMGQISHTLRVVNPKTSTSLGICEITLSTPDNVPIPLTFTTMSTPNGVNVGARAIDANVATCAISTTQNEPFWVASYTTARADAFGIVRLTQRNTGNVVTDGAMNGAEVSLDGEIIGTLVYSAGNAAQQYTFEKIPTAQPTIAPGFVQTRAPTTATPTFSPLASPEFFAGSSFAALGAGVVVALGALGVVLYLRKRAGGAGSYGTSGPSMEARMDMEGGQRVAKPIMAVPKSKAELAAEKKQRQKNAQGPPPAVRAAMEARAAEPARPAAPPQQYGNIAAPRTRGFLKNTNLGL